MRRDRQFQDVEKAVTDVYRHTLGTLKSDFAKLVYLASLRPLGTELYQHDGLSRRYGPELARQALERCHHEIVCRLIEKPLEDEYFDLERYFQGLEEDPESTAKRWMDQQSYRLLASPSLTPLRKKAFLLNCEVLLSLLHKKERLRSSL